MIKKLQEAKPARPLGRLFGGTSFEQRLMRLHWARQLAGTLTLLVLLSMAAAAAPRELRYELGFERPNTHLLDVTIHADQLQGPAVEFALPAWAPGSYFINDYGKLVQNFQASQASGRVLTWQKTDKQTWRVELGGATAVTIRYQLFADTLANNWAQYNDRHAFIGGPSVWMYLVGGKERPVRLSISVPQGWRVATGMTRADDGTFTATDYDWFADSPLEISDFVEKGFAIGGTAYHVIVHDVIGRKDFSKFFEDLQKIVATEVAMFKPVAGGTRDAPFATYWFLFHVWPNGRGGLEHLNSTQINYSTDWDDAHPAGRYGPLYNEKLFVAAHEFFHAWNVKRLRPKPLGPFDYSREAYTLSLWISEGLTSYYGDLALVRSGVMDPQAYVNSIAQLITSFEQEPGRVERTIEQTSWDTWFRNPSMGGANLANTWYSYYDGGEIIGHLLDFAIRHQTNNQKSLDDWMRLLYQRYALPKPGFEPDDAARAASEIAGADMSDFFRRYVSGKEPLPYETFFGYAGIHVERSFDSRAWLGVSSQASADGHVQIVNVIPGSPAELGGLDRDDVILSVDRRTVDPEKFVRRIGESKPGDVLKLTVTRLGELRELSVTLGSNPYATYSLKPFEHPTELQQKIYRSWLGLRESAE